MAKGKLTVVVDGQTITRRTDRTYTHVVVDRGWTAETIRRHTHNSIREYERQAAKYAETVEEQGHDDYISTVDPQFNKPHAYTEWIANCNARIEHEWQVREDADARAASQIFAATWHTRLDLAQREFAKRNDGSRQDVRLIEVQS